MLKIENTEVMGWEHAIRGMRNPKNSWEKSDSHWDYGKQRVECITVSHFDDAEFSIGPNDQKLMMTLRNAGTDHRKFMRMITVYLDITAPLYWWKEFDTYKVGTVANSTSTMHKIHSKPIEREDFSWDHTVPEMLPVLDGFIASIEALRKKFLETQDKSYWYSIIQLIPESYNQMRTVTLNYEVLTNIYNSRKAHKLDEWHTFCDWIKTLPYASELIIKE